MNKSLEIILALAVGLVVGLVVQGNSVIAPMGVSDQSAQLQKLEQQIAQAKKYFPPAQADVRSISGTIRAVQGSTLAVEVSGNPFDESPHTRNVIVGSQTKVVRSEQKDPAVFGQEIATYQKAVRLQQNKPSASPLTPPTPFRELPGKLTDITPGQQVTVAAGENIRDKASFTASIVSVVVAPGQGK